MKQIQKFYDTAKIVIKSFPKIIKGAFVLGIIIEIILTFIGEIPVQESLEVLLLSGLCILSYIAIMHFQRYLDEEHFLEMMSILEEKDE